MARPTLYLAGPEVFLDDAPAIFAAKRRMCRAHGLAPIAPFDDEAPAGSGRPLAARIYRANLARMDRADAILANLSPFRGPGADPGTAFELGYMVARGKPAFAYSNRPGTSLAGVRAAGGAVRGADGIWRDREGVRIEDFGLPENLMLAIATPILRAPEPRPIGDLQTFEDAVRRAASGLDATARAGAAPTSRSPADRRSRR